MKKKIIKKLYTQRQLNKAVRDAYAEGYAEGSSFAFGYATEKILNLGRFRFF